MVIGFPKLHFPKTIAELAFTFPIKRVLIGGAAVTAAGLALRQYVRYTFTHAESLPSLASRTMTLSSSQKKNRHWRCSYPDRGHSLYSFPVSQALCALSQVF
jgi:hypothetical protein